MRSKSTKTTGITIETGFDRLRTGRLQEAAAIANQLLSSNPNHHGALNLSGLIALNQGEKEQAVAQLTARVTAITKQFPPVKKRSNCVPTIPMPSPPSPVPTLPRSSTRRR